MKMSFRGQMSACPKRNFISLKIKIKKKILLLLREAMTDDRPLAVMIDFNGRC